MKKKLSVVLALLIGLAVAVLASHERSQAEPTTTALAPSLIAPSEKPGAPIDSLLEAHNRYLERSGRPDLRAPRPLECVDSALVTWGPINFADKQ